MAQPPEPFPDRIALRTRAADLDVAAVHAIRALAGGTSPVVVIVDAVEVSGEPGVNSLRVSRLPPAGLTPPGMALLYASDVMRVYSPRAR
jgi:hypothetical protein